MAAVFQDPPPSLLVGISSWSKILTASNSPSITMQVYQSRSKRYQQSPGRTIRDNFEELHRDAQLVPREERQDNGYYTKEAFLALPTSLESRQRRKRDDPSTFTPSEQTLSSTRTPLSSSASASSLVCYEDDPFRALLRFSSQAETFCPNYLTPGPHPVQTPVDLVTCGSATISSACSCFSSSIGWSSLTASVSQPFPVVLAAATATRSLRPPEPLQPGEVYTAPIQAPTVQVQTETLVSTKTFYQTFTLLNAPITVPTGVGAQTSGATGVETGRPGVTLWHGGGDVPSPVVVAMAVSRFFSRPTVEGGHQTKELAKTLHRLLVFGWPNVSADKYQVVIPLGVISGLVWAICKCNKPGSNLVMRPLNTMSRVRSTD